MRLFLALVPPVAVRAWLADAADRLGDHLPEGARRIRAEHMHCTLVFYGERDDTEGLLEATEGLRGATHLVRVGGRGAFPSLARARVVWIGIHQDPMLEAKASIARRAAGLQPEALTPHVSVARLRRPTSLRGLPEVGEGPVEPWAIELFGSWLSPGGRRYESL